MKFLFDKDVMYKEIAIAQEVIATKNALSILSNVLLIAENNTLTIKATDIKVNFETKIPIEIETEGKTTIFCDKLMSILTSLPSGEVEFIQDETKITIKPIAKKVKFQLKSMASDKFPEFINTDEVNFIEVPIQDLKDMITQTIFAVSDDETRYFMNGVYFDKKDDALILVATDGRRLSYISKALYQGVQEFSPAIVPPKILNIILKRAPNEGSISLAFVDNMIIVKFGNYIFTSVLIEGQFPNYERVIPEKQDFTFEVDKKDLGDALKRVGLLVEQKSHRVYFALSDGLLTISSQESDIGSAKEEIPCKYSGEDITMAFNYIYIEEPMKVINTERIRFDFTSSMKAVTVKSEPEKDFFHIVMPMQME
ncbi:MAG TPA: DNA polymerase III subunit beta [Treponemataceae bacterium]|nr:DNA polymerase III subunit beta [Treponemataceae bacterium]